MVDSWKQTLPPPADDVAPPERQSPEVHVAVPEHCGESRLVKVTVLLSLTICICWPSTVPVTVVAVAEDKVTESAAEVEPWQLPLRLNVPVTCVPLWINEKVPETQQQVLPHELLTWYCPDHTVPEEAPPPLGDVVVADAEHVDDTEQPTKLMILLAAAPPQSKIPIFKVCCPALIVPRETDGPLVREPTC